MYFTEEGFVVSGYELAAIIVLMIILYILVGIQPGLLRSKKDSNITYSDAKKTDKILDIRSTRHMIFEERVAGIQFRYNETTKILTIGAGDYPLEAKLEDGISEFREFVDRLGKYVNE